MDGFKYCKWCGAQIASNAKFCTNCGACIAPAQDPLVRYCRNCGRQINAGTGFCPTCGRGRPLAQNPHAFDMSPKDQAKLATRQRIAENRAQGVACCPRCGSTSITANTKGYGIGKGVIGAAVVGPLGLVAGNIGRHKVLITCLNCGYRFKPGW